MTHNTKTISYDTRAAIFWTLASICFLAFLVYIYSINMTIRNTVVRQDLEGQVAEQTADISSLEFEYISKQNGIGMELASAYGLKEVKTPAYASRTRATALTLNTLVR